MGFVYVLDRFLQRHLGLWVFMCPTNNTLFCRYFVYFVSILCLSFRLPRRGLPRPIYISPATTPRATTPHLYRTGHHASTTTAQLSRLCISRLPRQGLPRPILTTTGYHAQPHVHRVITPAISNSYFVVFISPASTPPLLLHLHPHRAPHATTCSTPSYESKPATKKV